MLVRTLLFVALSGFIFGAVGGWEAARVNTEIAVEKWRNYRDGTQVIAWPVAYDPTKAVPYEPSCAGYWNPDLDKMLNESRAKLTSCPGVRRVSSFGAWLLITVKTDELDHDRFLRTLPPMRETTLEEYRELWRSIHKPQPRGSCC
jgi:hypothetical protein